MKRQYVRSKEHYVTSQKTVTVNALRNSKASELNEIWLAYVTAVVDLWTC